MPATQTIRGVRPTGSAARWLQRIVLERRYGMPHGALRYVDLRELGFDAPDRVHEHIPSPWGVLSRILRKREVTPDDVFIDIGCGMGPVLVEAAARYDFRRIIGIDVVPEFTEVASKTIARGRGRLRCQDIEILTGDVTDYGLPDDVTVVFMADPFRSHVFDSAIATLIASVERAPRRLRIIYSNPVEGGRLERTGRAHLVRYGRRRNRPFATAPDLAMYELRPSDDGGPSAPPPPLPRELRRHPPDGRATRAADDGPEPAGGATIQIRSEGSSPRSRVALDSENGDIERLRAEFEDRHCVLLPRFLDGPLLERIQGYIDEGEFSARKNDGVPRELCMEHGKAAALLLLLINDRHLFRLVRKVTGCSRIGRFEGDIYRVMPGPEQVAAWHGDIFGHGMVEMSLDLSRRPYSGGVLEIRDRQSRELLHRAVDTNPGDALLVRVAPFLQQRLTAVEGDSPRTVYTGRFMKSKPGDDSKLAAPGRAAALAE